MNTVGASTAVRTSPLRSDGRSSRAVSVHHCGRGAAGGGRAAGAGGWWGGPAGGARRGGGAARGGGGVGPPPRPAPPQLLPGACQRLGHAAAEHVLEQRQHLGAQPHPGE
ncbi:hypothetical protein, partial [Nocardia farcinica]|uniref:hypothetical protein n=1 Tax=Nocardia farcinica TaxID=37329 RepID=UPI0024550406